jgi:hypothetical protein
MTSFYNENITLFCNKVFLALVFLFQCISKISRTCWYFWKHKGMVFKTSFLVGMYINLDKISEIIIIICLCYATFDRGLAQAEKVGVRGVGSIKVICVPGEHSAFIKKNKRKKNDSEQSEDKKKK